MLGKRSERNRTRVSRSLEKNPQAESRPLFTEEQIEEARQNAARELAEERKRRRQAAGPQLPPISVLEYTGGFADPKSGDQVLLPNGAVASTYLPNGFEDQLGLRPGGWAGPTKMAATDGADHFETVVQLTKQDTSSPIDTLELPVMPEAEAITAMPMSYPPRSEPATDTLIALPKILSEEDIESAQDADEERTSKRLLHLSLALTGVVVLLAGSAMIVGMTFFAQTVTGTSTNKGTEDTHKQAQVNQQSNQKQQTKNTENESTGHEDSPTTTGNETPVENSDKNDRQPNEESTPSESNPNKQQKPGSQSTPTGSQPSTGTTKPSTEHPTGGNTTPTDKDKTTSPTDGTAPDNNGGKGPSTPTTNPTTP